MSAPAADGGSTLAHVAPARLVDPGDGRVLAREEVLAAGAALATAMVDRGVTSGDVVAWQLPNRWQAVVRFSACWQLGATALPLHHRGGEYAGLPLAKRAGASDVLDPWQLEPDGFQRLLSTPPRDLPGARPDDDAVLLATSGSTGAPKLVRHTHRGLFGKARTMVAAHGLSADDVVLMPAPLAHISGLLNGVLVPGAAAMTTVLMDRWDPAAALALIEQHHVSFMIGPPTFFVDLWSSPSFTPDRVASLRLVSCGGSGVTPAFVDEASQRLQATVKRTYGSTEAPTVTTWHAGDPPDKARLTDGRPTADVQIAIVDPEDGHPRPAGSPGEVRVRGPEVSPGYRDTPGGPDPEGWFATGDLGVLDADGWLTIVGRLKDVIIRGGENIAPAAVEAACAHLPGVRLCVAVGVPDDRLGERVALVVEADAAPEPDAVRRACDAAGLPAFARPERIVVVDAIPRLDAGKPDRAATARLAIQRG